MIDFFIPVADWINLAFDAISISISPTLRAISAFLEIIIKGFENILLWPPEVVILLLASLLVWRVAGTRLAVFAFLGLLTIGMDVWQETMATVALALSELWFPSCLPYLWAYWHLKRYSREDYSSILDFMQTLPSFVYPIPAVMFWYG